MCIRDRSNITGSVRWTATRNPDAEIESTASDDTSTPLWSCLLYTSDAADERSSVDLGGRRIIKKKKEKEKIRSDNSET